MVKEEEFLKRLGKKRFKEGIIQMVFYTFDDDGNVILDEEEMQREFEQKLNEIKEILK